MKSKMEVNSNSSDTDCNGDENTKLFCAMSSTNDSNDSRDNGGCEGGVMNPVKPTKYAGSPNNQ